MQGLGMLSSVAIDTCVSVPICGMELRDQGSNANSAPCWYNLIQTARLLEARFLSLQSGLCSAQIHIFLRLLWDSHVT